MKANPLVNTPKRWLSALLLALLAVVVQTVLLMEYASADLLPALLDGVFSIALFFTLAYLSWFVVNFVSLVQVDVLMTVFAMLFWLGGSFIVQEAIGSLLGAVYAPFLTTLPFRLLIGLLGWLLILLGYRLQAVRELLLIKTEGAEEEEMQLQPIERVKESIDRITVKDGTRIHLIPIVDVLYIQACGDYVALITSSGQYVKEQTMKYFEAHLPDTGFVRIHRSSIVNLQHISRVELFGKDNYRLLLKNGEQLRVSNSGYRLLKERLDL